MTVGDMRRLVTTLAALVLPVFAPLSAQQNGSVKLRPDPHVTIGTLPNGLRYYIRENRRPEKRAELRLVVNAGSVLEGDDQRGLAHFLEHMAFNGTAHFARQELVSYLESIGMSFGADVNAYTGFDETVYMLTVPTDSAATFARGFEILEDWAHGVTLDSTEIEKERGVVIEEWRLGRGADERMRDTIFPVLFNNSRYAVRLPIGERSTLETFRPEAVKRFYRDWYRPDLMAVIAVGDFDKAQVERTIRERFARIPPPAGARARAAFNVEPQPTWQAVIATDKEAPTTRVELYRLLPVQSEDTEGAYRRGMIERLHNNMLNARLAELAQKPNPPFIGAGGGNGRLVRTIDFYALGAAVKEDGVLAGLEALLTESERARRHGFTESELDRTKRTMLRHYESAFAERDKTNSEEHASEYVRSYLEQEPIPGIEAEYEMMQRFLPGITLAEVNAVSRAWETPGGVIVVQAPAKEGVRIPAKRELLDLAAAVRARTIEPYSDLVANVPLVRNPPTGGSIVSERTTPEIGLTEWRLSNGARVLLKATDFKQDEVVFRAYSAGGASLASDSDYESAQFASLIVSMAGLGELDAVQLRKALAGKNVQVSPFISDTDEGLAGSASPRDLETLLQLTYLHFTAPRQDSAAFQSLMDRFRGAIQNRGSDPMSVFQDTVQVVLAQHHPRARPVTEEKLSEVDLVRALSFYRDRFADASDFTFAFVGSFNPDSLRPLIVRYLGGLPSINRKETFRDVGIRPPAGLVERTVRKGVEPRSQTRVTWSGEFEYTPHSRRVLTALGSALDIKLRDALREELGGTYGVSVQPTWSKMPYPHYSFTMDFGSAPDRVPELTRAALLQIDSMQKFGPSADVLQKVKETQRRAWETDVRKNSYWLSSIVTRDRIGEDQKDILAIPANIDLITPADVQNAARRYLPADRYVRVTLFPETADVSSTMNRIAEQYVGLVLAVGQHDPNYVDAYYGPKERQERAVAEKKTLAAIRAEATAPLSALQTLDVSGQEEIVQLRKQYLEKQLRSLVARVEMLEGKKFTFDEESKALYDAVAPSLPESHFQGILTKLEAQLPGTGSLAERAERFRQQFVIPKERLDTVFKAAIAEARRRTLQHVTLPATESFVVEYVTNKSWSGYNWYKGDLHSLIQVNTDLPIFIDRAVDLAAHEGYPGHHVYNALLEHELVKGRGWVEYSVYPLFSPQSLIAEGSENFGIEVAFPGKERVSFERSVLFPLAGLDAARVNKYYEVQALISQLAYAGNEAARRYLNGEINAEQAAHWLTRYALMSPERAQQRVRFMDTYRSYVINYNLGQDMVRKFVEKNGGTADKPERRWEEFRKLLSSPRLPSGLH
jgi:zinc protease